MKSGIHSNSFGKIGQSKYSSSKKLIFSQKFEIVVVRTSDLQCC